MFNIRPSDIVFNTNEVPDVVPLVAPDNVKVSVLIVPPEPVSTVIEFPLVPAFEAVKPNCAAIPLLALTAIPEAFISSRRFPINVALVEPVTKKKIPARASSAGTVSASEAINRVSIPSIVI